MLHQQETRVVRKLESKSIPQLQLLQHKALTSRASNKIKNLIQNALFEKHMAEMKEWEGQVDAWSKDCRDEERTGKEQQKTQKFQEHPYQQTLTHIMEIPENVLRQLE
jgi:hypothetical protein